ncbi:hypothetical protein [Streptomyces sp. NPDC050988]|uniref:hypothetical protein n=1 Tax=Streptomyces sp. NPDC050988 TaxID=3365637 RepID=UPI0037B66460
MVRTVIAHTHVDEDANSATSRTRGTGRCSTRSAARRVLETAVTASLTVPHEAKAEGLRWTRGLLRASGQDPALRAVWYRVNQESEDKLIPLVARLAGDDADPLEIRLAATDAIRVTLETWAESDADVEGPGSPAEPAVRCLRELTGGMRLLAEPSKVRDSAP